jgi:FixJ family two-component response regulator
MTMIKPTVFIIDDDPMICQAISWLLESVHLPSETFTDAEAYLAAHDASRQGCLLIDVRMPGISGLELQQRLNALHNPIPILMISGHGDVPMAVRAMQAGAKDFILKPFNDQVLLEKIQAAIAQDIKRSRHDPSPAIAERFTRLTPREQQVMVEVVAGKLNKQIAANLAISISTVEMHRAKIMQKLEVRTLAELIKTVLEYKV